MEFTSLKDYEEYFAAKCVFETILNTGEGKTYRWFVTPEYLEWFFQTNKGK